MTPGIQLLCQSLSKWAHQISDCFLSGPQTEKKQPQNLASVMAPLIKALLCQPLLKSHHTLQMETGFGFYTEISSEEMYFYLLGAERKNSIIHHNPITYKVISQTVFAGA